MLFKQQKSKQILNIVSFRFPVDTPGLSVNTPGIFGKHTDNFGKHTALPYNYGTTTYYKALLTCICKAHRGHSIAPDIMM